MSGILGRRGSGGGCLCMCLQRLMRARSESEALLMFSIDSESLLTADGAKP